MTGLWSLVCLLLVTTACGRAIQREATDSFVDEGYTSESANCIADLIEGAGFTSDDLVEPMDAGVTAMIASAVPACIRDEDLPGILNLDSMSDVEQLLVDQLVGTGIVTDEQARCVLDGSRDRGLGLVDINGMRAPDDAAQQAITEVTAACVR